MATLAIERKSFSAITKDGGSGFQAIVSTDAVDADNDIVMPSAFEVGKQIPILVGHKWDELAVGRGTVWPRVNDVRMQASFFSTDRGKEAEQTLAGLGDLAQFSIGFRPTDIDHKTVDGKTVRIIRKLQLFEVSMVTVGASPGTGLIAHRSARSEWERFQASERARKPVNTEAHAILQDFRRREALRC